MEAYDEDLDEQVTIACRNDFGMALQLANSLVERFPKNRRAWASLAYVHQSFGNNDDAIYALNIAVNCAPHEPVSHFSLGLAKLDSEIFDNAIVNFSNCLGLCEKYDDSYYSNAARLLRSYANAKIEKYAESKADLICLDNDTSWWIGNLVDKKFIYSMLPIEFR